MTRHKITLIHASRASIAPLNDYYPKQAPELELTNLLDDGIMRLFRTDDTGTATRRLVEMIATGRDIYRAELAVLACSAVTPQALEELRAGAGILLLKIDEPMMRLAVAAGSRIGVIVSFAPTQAVTRRQLQEAAAGKTIEIIDEVVPEAVEAILAGDEATHGRLLTEAADRLAGRSVDAIVLAQVSMTHLVERITERTRKPAFSSLETSLTEIRRLLEEAR